MSDPAAKFDVEVVGSSYAAAMEQIALQARGPVLQIGSRAAVLDFKVTNWRQRLGDRPFVGLDVESGENVDVIADIAGEFAQLRSRLKVFQFETIICAHVLEHVRRPWDAARNIERLLAPGGLLFIQVPWVQAYHPFPDDYWRFSFSGVRALFDRIRFDQAFYSGGSSDRIYSVLKDGAPVLGGDVAAIEAKLFQVLLSHEENTRFINDLSEKRLSLSRGYMPVTVVNLVGRKSK